MVPRFFHKVVRKVVRGSKGGGRTGSASVWRAPCKHCLSPPWLNVQLQWINKKNHTTQGHEAPPTQTKKKNCKQEDTRKPTLPNHIRKHNNYKWPNPQPKHNSQKQKPNNTHKSNHARNRRNKKKKQTRKKSLPSGNTKN